MDVFERLARKLSELPQGYPRTESGVELRILRLIFGEDEAALALHLSPVPETAGEIATRLGLPVEDTRARLDIMAKKGQIASVTLGGRQVYRILPFVIGMYEQQRQDRLTHELVHLFEEYMPSLCQELGAHPPHAARVVPAHLSLNSELTLLPHEDIRQIIDKAKSFRVQDCICRREQDLLGRHCSHALKYCLHYSLEENAFDYFNPDGEIITREKAWEIIHGAEQEGLVHTTHNVKAMPVGFICSCCSCCCGLIRALKDFHSPFVLAKSNYLAQIDQEKCQACGVCKDERCPMGAIEEDGEVYRVNDTVCIGCGVCVITCPGQALSLVARPEADRDKVPEDMRDWGIRRVAG